MKHASIKQVIDGIPFWLVGFGWLCGLLGGCVAGDLVHADDPASADKVPVALHAGQQTKAVIGEGEAFEPLLLCSAVSGDYTVTEWQKAVSVATDGSVAYKEEPIPYYPSRGDYIYLSGIHPSDGTVAGGTATFSLDGQTDLLYASELSGNRWDGFRIYGNSDPSKDRQLQFGHLLTQLQFAALRTATDLTGKKEFRILSIRIKGVPGQAVVRFDPVENEAERTAWSRPGDVSPVLYKDPSDHTKNKLITSSDPKRPDKAGWVLVPPLASFQADIETTVGHFNNLTIRPDDGPFIAGLAHQVVLIFNERGLSVVAVREEDWTEVDGGEIEMN